MHVLDLVAERLFNYINDVLYNPDRAELEVEALPSGFRDLGIALVSFANGVIEVSRLAKELACGRLSSELPPPENELAAPLNALNATLRQLTWQTHQVARGDYSQCVDLTGEFADGFNVMVEQLVKQRAALLDEIESSQRKLSALAQNSIVYETTAGQMDQWIIIADCQSGHWLFVSRDIKRDLIDPAFEEQLCTWMNGQIKLIRDRGKTYSKELELKSGEAVQSFFVTISLNDWNEADVVTFVLTDTSSERERLKKLEDAVFYDVLTGVHNRYYGMEMLKQWLAENLTFILIFIDLDNLKYVNDRLGHLTGDQYLKHVAAVLRRFSEEAVVCRLSGDEFMILAKDWTADQVESRMETLRDGLIAENAEPNALYDQSISYGMAANSDGYSASEMMGLADRNMYEYKRLHKPKHRTQPPGPAAHGG